MPHDRSDAGSKVTLPITPMLDMTFQLLFFFIVSFHPADPEGQMDMSLPTEVDGPGALRLSRPAAPAEPEFPIDLTVKVRTQLNGVNDGDISAISVRTMEGKEEPMEMLDGLRAYLKEKRESLTNKDAIKLQGDGKLKVKSIMKVMDVCRKAGFANVTFMPPDDMGR